MGMRRSTRVFGVVKGADGARVLRSGRRLWPDSGEAYFRRPNDGSKFYQLVQKSQKNVGIGDVLRNPNANEVVVEDFMKNHMEMEVEPQERADRMYGLVYTRKRKSTGDGSFLANSQDKNYCLQFSRRQRRKTSGFEVSPVFSFLVNDGGSCGWTWWFSCFLSLILRYMKRENVRLPELAAFLMSRPIFDIFSSNGFKIVLGPANGTGVCKIFDTGRFSPMFSLDLHAVPQCFMYLHYRMFLQLKCLGFDPVDNLTDDSDDEMIIITETQQACVPALKKCQSISPDIKNLGNEAVLHPSNLDSKLANRSNQCKTGLSSCGIQKRRSSFRRRVRSISIGGVNKVNEALISDFLGNRRNKIPFSFVVSKNKLRRSVRSCYGTNLQELNCVKVDSPKIVDSSCCSASLLVIETDRCYREEGAIVSLELTASKESLIVVKKDGLTMYTHKAQKDMKPCATNRVTHAIIWTGEENWKLEFPNRNDWSIFKELYKESLACNVSASVVKAIPVPVVREVLDFEVIYSMSFQRPDSYISVIADEVSRAMSKTTANYDMDSEDEEWLTNFNNVDFSGSNRGHVSDDSFELLIDALEKGYYCSPDGYSKEIATSNVCFDVCSKEVVEGVYDYWMRKRKQKQSALLRAFQGHRIKKAPLVPEQVLRKRRSFKRKPSHGRSKQPSFLQAMAVERDAVGKQNTLQEANNSVESASEKRKRAQLLAENADIATYKALVALRIAEAARVAEGSDTAAAILFF